jgi:N6-adenosine-specific RNA methylase IME4/ParB-like chromosome segregation protein Spo0J
MEVHEVAAIFPLMSNEEYRVLVDDIRANGLLEPIWLYKDKIIDGRNRWKACQELGVKPICREWHGQGSLISFVVSRNLARRHLTSSQKAVVALEIERQLAKEARAQQGARTDLLQTIAKGFQPINAATQAATIVGTNRQYVSDAKRIQRTVPTLLNAVQNGTFTIPEARSLASLPNHQRETVLNLVETRQARTIKEGIRKTRLAAQVSAIETMQPPRGQYHVIVADPPWTYTKRTDDLTHRGTTPYPAMTVEEISAMPVQDLAYTNCILWLWTTNAFMGEAHHIASTWGFHVKTILTWAKNRMGVGDWLRGQTEHCLMAVRGRPVVTLKNQTTLLQGSVREHSRKPAEFYQLVESLCPGTKCELFAREPRAGWTVFGAERNMYTVKSQR